MPVELLGFDFHNCTFPSFNLAIRFLSKRSLPTSGVIRGGTAFPGGTRNVRCVRRRIDIPRHPVIELYIIVQEQRMRQIQKGPRFSPRLPCYPLSRVAAGSGYRAQRKSYHDGIVLPAIKARKLIVVSGRPFDVQILVPGHPSCRVTDHCGFPFVKVVRLTTHIQTHQRQLVTAPMIGVSLK